MRQRKTDRHLPACVYRKHGAYWLVRKGKWTRLGTALQPALALYARLIEAPAGAGSMAAFIDEAMPFVTANVSEGTRKQYQSAANHLKEAFAEIDPQDLSSAQVRQLRRHLIKMPNTANRCVSVLRMIYEWAQDEEMVEHNPCDGVKRLEEGKRDRYITDGELKALRKAASDSVRIAIDLLYYTGQRVSDVLGIRLTQLTDEGIVFQQGKTGAKLTVEWCPELTATVEEAKALHGNVRAMTLLHNRGKRIAYRTFHDAWVALCTATGIEDAHIHDIRAKALTDAKRQGHNPTALAGHKSAQMTERYIRLREAVQVKGPSIRRELERGRKNKKIGR